MLLIHVLGLNLLFAKYGKYRTYKSCFSFTDIAFTHTFTNTNTHTQTYTDTHAHTHTLTKKQTYICTNIDLIKNITHTHKKTHPHKL